MDFRGRLKSGFLLLDGAMGTELQLRGLAPGQQPERLNFTHPEWVEAVHRSYVAAGSDAVYTNTFQANRLKLGQGMDVQEVVAEALAIARRSGAAWVGQDVGPTGALIEPMGTLSWEEAYELFREQVVAGVKHGADFFALETFTSLYELKAALLAVKENSDLPVLCTMSFEQDGHTVNGTDVGAMALTLERLGADAIGFNCSVGAAQMIALSQRLTACTSLPIIVKANAGIPNGKLFSPQEFADCYRTMMQAGVGVIGGCCGTTPAHIAALHDLRRTLPFPVRPPLQTPPAVCSETRVVTLDRVRVVGERINPTGKKKMKAALIARDFGYMRGEAIAQTENGAEILDVNCGIPEIEEEEVLPQLVKCVQARSDCPVMIDTSSPAALERALRVANGVPIVNSVNADPKTLARILPLVRRYGAAVVGLCLDDDGIPPDAAGRVALGKRIVAAAGRHGIGRDRVILDALTLTVATGDYAPEETLQAVAKFHKLGINTILGVSNISFGMPNREVINAFFLSAALRAGLGLAIVNPASALMMDAVSAHRLLTGQPDVRGGIRGGYGTQPAPGAPAQVVEEGEGLIGAIVKGDKDACVALTRALLEQQDPRVVIEDHLIKGLDRVGQLYEEHRLFLPGLIAAADAAKAAFGVLAERMPAGLGEKGKVLLATVKGDIHDIGKNIVKAVVENYGYRVLDLGKDVPPETIVKAALENDVGLVGLSALMTTTATAMAETVRQLKEGGYRGKIMVGGAVITAEFAAKIGADFYAKDANASVRIAAQVFGR